MSGRKRSHDGGLQDGMEWRWLLYATRMKHGCRVQRKVQKNAGSKPKWNLICVSAGNKDIDVVIITTCNHWHALGTIWSCQAGKHVYVEKPVNHRFREGRQMVEVARKYNRLVQGGTQRRSDGLYKKAVQLLHDGVIGDIYMTRCFYYGSREPIGVKAPKEPPEHIHWDLWLGPAPEQPYHENLAHYNWHWFWDFGNGELGNNGSHIIDVMRWGSNKKLPVKIHSNGGRYGWDDQAQTPNTQICNFEFDDGSMMVCEIRNLPTNDELGARFGGTFYGTEGYMTITDGKYEIFKGNSRKPEPDQGKLDSQEHMANFIDAVRANDRSRLNAEVEEVFLSCAFCNLGNIAYRLDRTLSFDTEKEEFINDDEANAMLTRENRKGFEA